MKKWFYGIRGIEFIWRGAWADPELIWHKKSFNYYDVETPLYETYKEELQDGRTQLDFETWVKKNAYLARYYLQNLLEYKCFYGGAAQ